MHPKLYEEIEKIATELGGKIKEVIGDSSPYKFRLTTGDTIIISTTQAGKRIKYDAILCEAEETPLDDFKMKNRFSVKSISDVGFLGEKVTCKIPVTAQWLWEEGTDIPAYIFDKEAWHANPWTKITGVDAVRDGSEIILQYGRTGEKRVALDYLVYISKDTDKGSRWHKCPRCFAEGEFVGLSRKDNETILCPICEHREACDEYYKPIGG